MQRFVNLQANVYQLVPNLSMVVWVTKDTLGMEVDTAVMFAND